MFKISMLIFSKRKKVLNLKRSVLFSIKSDTVMSGWSIVYIEGPQISILKKIVFLSLKVNFAIANSADYDASFCSVSSGAKDPEQTLCSVVSDHGLHCLSMSHKKDTRLIWVVRNFSKLLS